MRRKPIRHGMSFTGVGKSWHQMMDRVFNKKSKDYKSYGGAGIPMCEFIAATPVNLKILIGERPQGHSIDRIIGTKGYTCGVCRECINNQWDFNVRWATSSMQRRNISTNRNVSFNGETMCLQDWSARTGIKYSTLVSRHKIGESGKILFRGRYSKKI